MECLVWIKSCRMGGTEPAGVRHPGGGRRNGSAQNRTSSLLRSGGAKENRAGEAVSLCPSLHPQIPNSDKLIVPGMVQDGACVFEQRRS